MDSFKKGSFITISLMVQIILLLFLIFFNAYINIIKSAYIVFSIFLILGIIKSSNNLSSELPCIMIMILFPIIGPIIFLIIEKNIPNNKIMHDINTSINKSFNYLSQDKNIYNEIEFSQYANLKYISEHIGFPITKNNEITYCPTGESTFNELIYELNQAKKFIFIEFFTINKSSIWQEILNILQRKVKEGVEVRIIYDYMGSLGQFSKNYLQELDKIGIKYLTFNKVFPPLGIVMNNRDHRKIVVIDGNVAFTGGINIADEYINLIHPHSYWKDNGVKIKGEAVWSFTVMFLSFWNAYKKEDSNYSKYKAYPKNRYENNGYIVPYSISPLDKEKIAENIYLNIINQARNYVYIYTPYLVIDDIIINSLILAAKRGVDVRIIVPGIPDKKTVYYLTTSYFKTLVDSGVKVYTYTNGFLHSKVFLADDKVATVGSINLDYRSLYLHFECGVYIEETNVIKDIKADIIDTIKKSKLVTNKETKTNIFKTIIQIILRLFAPLM